MTHILNELFGIYGETILQAHNLYGEDKLMEAMEQLLLDKVTKIAVCDLFSEHYLHRSAVAFAVGLHLSLSLLGKISRKT